MNQRDKDVLDAMHQTLVKFLSEPEIQLLHQEVEKAGGVAKTTGYARELLEKSAAIMAGAVASRSFGGNRSAAGQYAARMRWGRSGGSSGGGGGGEKKTASPVGSLMWDTVASEFTQVDSETFGALGAKNPITQRLQEARTEFERGRKADNGGLGEVIPSAADRAATHTGTAGMLLTLAANSKGAPASIKKLAKKVNDMAEKLKARAKEGRGE